MRRASRTAMRFVALPVLLYLGLFIALTYPLIGAFSSRFFTNAGDGLQNVWNLWWINRAVTELHTSPWFTTYLYYPTGISLVGHTLNPFNGFVAIGLLRFLTLVQAHNVIVVFSFVMAGVTACWLAYVFCGHYWASIVGGSVFTFSEYHFAHADGHLQLISLEWLPLFALVWYWFVRKPTYRLAVAAAAVLLLVILCDFYYFAYSLLYAAIMVGIEAWRRRDPLLVVRRPLVVFVAVAGVTSGQLVWRLLALNAVDPLLGSHDAASFSTDLFGAFIPGGHWRFADLTRSYWEALPGNIHESSVDIGFGVVAALAYAVARRTHPLVRDAGVWWVVLTVFWLLSLGPVLTIWGVPHPRVPMPYSAMQALLPAISLSGVPTRMMVMVTLAAAVLVSIAFGLLFSRSWRSRVFASALLVVLAVEYLPRAVPTTLPEVPAYIYALRSLPESGGVLDAFSGYYPDRPFGSDGGIGLALYYQTIHERPMAAGYVARVPSSAWAAVVEQKRLLDAGAYAALACDYGFPYVVVGHGPALAAPAQLVFADSEAGADVFDLGGCALAGLAHGSGPTRPPIFSMGAPPPSPRFRNLGSEPPFWRDTARSLSFGAYVILRRSRRIRVS